MRSKVIADSANHGWPKYLRYLPAEPVEIHKGVQINHYLHVLVAQLYLKQQIKARSKP